MSKYKIKDLAVEISQRIDNPKTSGYDKFVGLEHYDSGEVMISRYGKTDNLDSSVKLFQKGDILIARRNVYLRRAGLVDFDGVTSGDSIVVRANDEIIQRLLPFVFNTKEFWDFANQFADGSMSKRLSPKLLMDYETELPDTNDDRTKLADLLWSVFDTMTSYKELIKQSDELVKSRFIEMFGDAKKVRLGDYIEQIRGVSYKPSDLGDEADESHTTLLRANNISNNEINFDDVKFVTDSKVQKNQLIKQGDILICGSSGSKEHVGKAALCKFDGKFTYGTFCKLIRATKEISPVFISEYFRSDEYREYIKQIACGANINNLRNEHIDSILIPYPSEDDQKTFICFVQQVDKSKFILQESFSKLEMFYKKIMNQYLKKED